MDTPEAGDTPDAAGATGGDNVQHGDQSAPDAPGAAETQDTRIAYPVSRDWGRRQRKPGAQDSREGRTASRCPALEAVHTPDDGAHTSGAHRTTVLVTARVRNEVGQNRSIMKHHAGLEAGPRLRSG